VQLGIDANGKVFWESNISGTVKRATGDTVLEVDGTYVIVVTHDGTNVAIRVNGTAQTLAGDADGGWFGDVSGRDAVTVGALVVSSGATDLFDGYVAEVALYDDVKVASQIAQLEHYAAERYGITL